LDFDAASSHKRRGQDAVFPFDIARPIVYNLPASKGGGR